MKKFRFRQFQIYNDARVFRNKLKRLSRQKFPKDEQFCLTSQLWRALDSIILNIAEGADRGTDRDFAHFLNISHTSLNEVVACLDLAVSNSYIPENENNIFLIRAENLANQITHFKKKILKEPTK